MSLSEGQKLTLRAAVSGSGKSTGATAIPVQWTGPPVLRVGLPPRVLRRVEEYIDLHLGETISLEALADVAGLSLSHFARTFRQSKGMSAGNYLLQRRVERTMELLTGTHLSLAEIALAVGFSDQSHCSRSFCKHVGIGPRAYRRSRL